MPFIGNAPSNNFVSLKRQDITGDGTASYTLDYKVASVNDVLIYVNHVKQDPSSYTISGTSLTMGGTVASTDDFYVIFLGQALQTVTPKDNTITTAMLQDDAVTISKGDGNFGLTRQFVSTQDGAVATGTTTFPEDDTIPQNTEGDEYMTLSITPKSATSKLLITAQVFGSVSTGTRWGIGLFKDSNADALSFASTFVDDATSMSTCYIEHSLTSGSTSAQTFKIRAGSIQTAATFSFNGQSGNRRFGGTILSSIHITEIGE